MQKFRIPYIPYRSLLLSTTVWSLYTRAAWDCCTSLSTVVLSSRDRWEIVWLPKNFALSKNRLECIGKAVPRLNEAISQIF